MAPYWGSMPIEIRTGKPISSRIVKSLLASGPVWKDVRVFTKRAPPNEVRDVYWEMVSVGVVTASLPLVAELQWAGERNVARAAGCGNVCVAPPRTPFTHRWRQPIDIIHISLAPAIFDQIDADGLGTRSLELRPTAYVEDSLINSLALALQQEVRTSYPGGASYGESLGAMLAAHLVRRYGVFTRRPHENRSGLTRGDLRSVIEYIEEQLESRLSLYDLAGVVSMGVYNFLRRFRRSIGIPPHQYVLRRRVERAKALLVNRDLSIAEIAVRCGFYSQSHLTTAFHRLTQVTPRDFRRAVAASDRPPAAEAFAKS
jgi:AraC family transcriptional regulator